MVTIIEDREEDIYKQFSDAPGGTVHLLVRDSQNRKLDNGKKLHAHLKELPVQGSYEMDIVQQLHRDIKNARPGCRSVLTGLPC